jgi:hypothetical protein
MNRQSVGYFAAHTIFTQPVTFETLMPQMPSRVGRIHGSGASGSDLADPTQWPVDTTGEGVALRSTANWAAVRSSTSRSRAMRRSRTSRRSSRPCMNSRRGVRKEEGGVGVQDVAPLPLPMPCPDSLMRIRRPSMTTIRIASKTETAGYSAPPWPRHPDPQS